MMSRKNRRSTLEQWGDILRACVEGKTITSILYATNINTTVLHNYVDLMIEKKTIMKIDGKYPLYATSAKGKKWLLMYEALLKLEIPCECGK